MFQGDSIRTIYAAKNMSSLPAVYQGTGLRSFGYASRDCDEHNEDRKHMIEEDLCIYIGSKRVAGSDQIKRVA
jgi:hypothetical protein